MNLDTALQKHAEWKTRFRTAISQNETLDAVTIAKDNCCEFGKWLYGENRATLGMLDSHKECVAKHKIFHIEAGKIATAINLKKYDEAEVMLGINTPYFNASNETAVAIIRLKKEVGSNTTAEKTKIGGNAVFFNWSDDLSVGNDFIDNDHKKLIKMINSFHTAMQEGRGNDVIGKVLNNLSIYTTEHFAREEDEMRHINYKLFDEHRREHDQLLKEVEDLQNDLNNGKMLLTSKISTFLKDWWHTHISKSDKLLAAAIRKAG